MVVTGVGRFDMKMATQKASSHLSMKVGCKKEIPGQESNRRKDNGHTLFTGHGRSDGSQGHPVRARFPQKDTRLVKLGGGHVLRPCRKQVLFGAWFAVHLAYTGKQIADSPEKPNHSVEASL